MKKMTEFYSNTNVPPAQYAKLDVLKRIKVNALKERFCSVMTQLSLVAFFAIFLQMTLEAQESTYVRTPGYWTFGINGGLSYQQSDVPLTLDGYGFGLTLAKNLYYRPGDLFSFDLRGRALYAESHGIDHNRSYGVLKNEALNGTGGLNYTKEDGSTGFVFQNNSTQMGELGLEGVISFNRLREQTNVILNLFGGVGIDWYRTKIDQRNSNGLYATDYMGIDTTASRSTIRNNLKNAILDGDFETYAEGFDKNGKLAIMPSLGIELGYQLTPRFSIGLGHKVTFARNDILDGQKWTNDNLATGDNDIHHYTNLNLRWIIDPHREELEPPLIQIIDPNSNPYTSRNPNGFVKAKIQHVKNAMDIDYTVNGESVSFNYRKGVLNNSFLLEEGNNEVIITATNSAGRDQKKVIIAYQPKVNTQVDPPQQVDPPYVDPGSGPRVYRPTVEFTRPSRTTERVENDRYRVRATIENINRKEDVYFAINGQQVSDFSFNSRTGAFVSNIILREGDNQLYLEVTNPEGRDRDEATVVLERAYESQPSIEITKPYSDPHNTTKAREVIEAKVYNVSQKRDLTYKVNGRTISQFDYDGKVFRGNADLNRGKNTIEVIVRTQGGDDRDQTIIYFDEPTTPQLNPPVVTITDPRNSVTTRNEKNIVKATIVNVDNKRDIIFSVNGRRTYDFDFSTRSKVLTANVPLELGNNRIRIIAENNDGKDEATVNITREKEKEVVLIQRPPTVSITKPADRSTTDKSTTDLEAKVQNITNKQDIKVTINGQNVSNFSFDARRNKLTAKLTLRKGTNTIVVKASNERGTDDASVKVDYKVEVANPPTVDITQPTQGSTKDEKVTLKAKVKNVTNKNDIQVLLNGRGVSSFYYSTSRGDVSATLTLKKGSNTIVVKAKTSDGSDEDRHTITYQAAVTPPKVTFRTPRNNSTSSKQEVEVEARIENVSNAKDITFLVNGNKAVRPFNFKNGVLKTKVLLSPKNNELKIKAVNEGGKDEAKIMVRYTKPTVVEKPIVKFITPRRSGTTARSNTSNIKVSILNVTNKKDISLSVNGRRVSKFDFNTRKKELRATVTLKTGSNTVKIEATNKAGKGSASTVIKSGSVITIPTAKAPKVSSISASQPSVSPANPDVGKSLVTAILENVSRKSEITMTLNGANVSNFEYNSSTKKMTAVVDLVRGENTIVVKVKNRSGNDELSKKVIF